MTDTDMETSLTNTKEGNPMVTCSVNNKETSLNEPQNRIGDTKVVDEQTQMKVFMAKIEQQRLEFKIRQDASAHRLEELLRANIELEEKINKAEQSPNPEVTVVSQNLAASPTSQAIPMLVSNNLSLRPSNSYSEINTMNVINPISSINQKDMLVYNDMEMVQRKDFSLNPPILNTVPNSNFVNHSPPWINLTSGENNNLMAPIVSQAVPNVQNFVPTLSGNVTPLDNLTSAFPQTMLNVPSAMNHVPPNNLTSNLPPISLNSVANPAGGLPFTPTYSETLRITPTIVVTKPPLPVSKPQVKYPTPRLNKFNTQDPNIRYTYSRSHNFNNWGNQHNINNPIRQNRLPKNITASQHKAFFDFHSRSKSFPCDNCGSQSHNAFYCMKPDNAQRHHLKSSLRSSLKSTLLRQMQDYYSRSNKRLITHRPSANRNQNKRNQHVHHKRLEGQISYVNLRDRKIPSINDYLYRIQVTNKKSKTLARNNENTINKKAQRNSNYKFSKFYKDSHQVKNPPQLESHQTPNKSRIKIKYASTKLKTMILESYISERQRVVELSRHFTMDKTCNHSNCPFSVHKVKTNTVKSSLGNEPTVVKEYDEEGINVVSEMKVASDEIMGNVSNDVSYVGETNKLSEIVNELTLATNYRSLIEVHSEYNDSEISQLLC